MVPHSHMLNDVLPDITRFCRIMATVTGVDIEIVDAGLVRVAGTGIYADKVGHSIELASEIYRHALGTGSTVYIDNPRQHPVCAYCANRDDCHELLNLCTPIILEGKTLGVIGLVCFNEPDKDRVLAQVDVFTEFVEQIAGVIANTVAEAQRSRRVNQMLDMLLQVTDNTNSILILDKNGHISYANEGARQEFSLDGNDGSEAPVSISPTGNNVADLDEFELRIGETVHSAFGRFIALDSPDEAFSAVLLSEPLPRLTERLSHFGGSAKSAGGLSTIVGHSGSMSKLRQRVLQIARTSSTVLITGESGTGKEMFARAIHMESDRRDKPFVAINCGAIPDGLLESELFGYVRGAFTGAGNSGRMGKFELAHGGVIFLDEIGSMSLYLQVKLLRVLQEKSFTRLGSNRPITVDVRIIAATNDNLAELIEQKMFRSDLYYRLNVIPLELPPLRSRVDDIPILAEYFFNRYCARFGKPAIRLSPQILAMLQAYPWPGNVREFENCIEYMVNMHESGPLSPALLPVKIRSQVAGPYSAAALHQTEGEGCAPAGQHGAEASSSVPHSGAIPPPAETIIPLAELERAAIHNAVQHFGDSTHGKKLAAEALGIGIATLYRKLH